MKISHFLSLLFLLSYAASADTIISVGAGKGILKAPGTPFERVVALEYQLPASPGVFVGLEIGWFMDGSGRGLSSPWSALRLGSRAVSAGGTAAHLAFGPGYLHNPDQVLAGHFQFSLEGGLEIADINHGIGIAWKHLSSGGISMPNLGRDFVVTQLRFPTPAK